MPRKVDPLLADLVDLDFRLRWWNRLTIDNPQVADRLIAKFPEHYPVRRKESHDATSQTAHAPTGR